MLLKAQWVLWSGMWLVGRAEMVHISTHSWLAVHMADTPPALASSFACLQDKVDATYKDEAKWARMSIMMTAGAGKFSTDRTIKEYAKDIWDVKPCVVPQPDS